MKEPTERSADSYVRASVPHDTETLRGTHVAWARFVSPPVMQPAPIETQPTSPSSLDGRTPTMPAPEPQETEVSQIAQVTSQAGQIAQATRQRAAQLRTQIYRPNRGAAGRLLAVVITLGLAWALALSAGIWLLSLLF